MEAVRTPRNGLPGKSELAVVSRNDIIASSQHTLLP